MHPTNPILPGQEESYPSASEDEIVQFEKFYNVTLPPRYRNFLRTINGGYFSFCRLATADIEDGVVRPAPYGQWLQDLRSIALPPNDTLSIYHEAGWQFFKNAEDMWLTIGSTEDGGLLLLELAPEPEKIWLKTPDFLLTFDDKTYQSEWFVLNNNIDEFLKRLSFEPEVSSM